MLADDYFPAPTLVRPTVCRVAIASTAITSFVVVDIIIIIVDYFEFVDMKSTSVDFHIRKRAKRKRRKKRKEDDRENETRIERHSTDVFYL